MRYSMVFIDFKNRAHKMELVTNDIMKILNQLVDGDHPYGHGKAEVISSGIVVFILNL